jgi:hypothetical protein
LIAAEPRRSTHSVSSRTVVQTKTSSPPNAIRELLLMVDGQIADGNVTIDREHDAALFRQIWAALNPLCAIYYRTLWLPHFDVRWNIHKLRTLWS